MDEIKMNDLKKIRNASSHDLLIPRKEFDEVKNVVAYGILRRYANATKKKFFIKGLNVWDIFGSYPHAFLVDGKQGIVNKLMGLANDMKDHIDNMETYAGYDTYSFIHKGDKFHIYIGGDRMYNRYVNPETNRHSHRFLAPAQECDGGDFYKHKRNKAWDSFVKFRKARKEWGGEVPTWDQYCKYHRIFKG